MTRPRSAITRQRPIEIDLVGAVFRCETERVIFFQRLTEIPGLQKTVVEDEVVTLTVASDLEDEAVAQLRPICDMWSATYQLRSWSP